MILDSTTAWDSERQRQFWNEWDARHLQVDTLGCEALRRGDVILSMLKDLRIDAPHILELGCGNGWLAEKLVAFGPVTGVDISEVAIAEARRRVPGERFCIGDALRMDLPMEAFDVVVTLETLSHVSNQNQFICVIARVLKRHGYLLLATQNRTIYMRRGDVGAPAVGQIRRWVTMRELRGMLKPYFDISKAFTIQPAGRRGFLRFVNSATLNKLCSKVIPELYLHRFKEMCGLGQTLIVLARKRVC
jgi:2-polyprenyl-3-methyl-5-hydroxy-6-metoxy-1,4-benzoquinol methylase